uniref:Uncharacterized protein n=1 Tax=Rhizophora mucronata TaxID=61149 RepID=A0A2P2R499_RHIMU
MVDTQMFLAYPYIFQIVVCRPCTLQLV